MKTIWKFQVQITDEPSLTMPAQSALLPTVVFPSETVAWLWAVVDTDAPPMEVRLRIIGTGNPMPEVGHLVYVASGIAGPCVWHIFVSPETPMDVGSA